MRVVPDECIGMIRTKLEQNKMLMLYFDWIPRTMKQAKALDAILAEL